jgi:hypothetical protein
MNLGEWDAIGGVNNILLAKAMMLVMPLFAWGRILGAVLHDHLAEVMVVCSKAVMGAGRGQLHSCHLRSLRFLGFEHVSHQSQALLVAWSMCPTAWVGLPVLQSLALVILRIYVAF